MTTEKHPWPNLIWQPILAIIFIAIVLFIMGQFSNTDVLWAVGAGSLSSSSYIVFGNPSSKAALPWKIIGGYLVGILTGLLLRYIMMYFHDYECGLLGVSHSAFVGIVAAISVGLCLFLMSLLKVQHPPAAGMALVLVIDMHDYNEILFITLAALTLAFIRWLFSSKLVDLR